MNDAQLLSKMKEDARIEGKTVEEIINMYTEDSNFRSQTLEDINRTGSNLAGWKNLKEILDKAILRERGDLHQRLNKALLTRVAYTFVNKYPETGYRYPEEMMYRLSPQKTRLSKAEEDYNKDIQAMFLHPEGNSSKLIKFHRDMMKKVEDNPNIGRFISEELYDEDLVEHMDSILDIKSCLHYMSDTRAFLKNINVLNEDGTINNGTVCKYEDRSGNRTEEKLTDEDKAYLADYLRLCDKYNVYAEKFNNMAFRIGAIQNPYYEIIDYDDPQLTAVSEDRLALGGEEDGATCYPNGALPDYLNTCSNLAQCTTHGELELVEDYFIENKGVAKKDLGNLMVQFSGDNGEYNYGEKKSSISRYRGGADGFVQIYEKDKPQDGLTLRLDGKNHLVSELGGSKELSDSVEVLDVEMVKRGQPKMPTKPKPPMSAPPAKPGWFKRLFHTMFGLFSDTFQQYNDELRRYQNDPERYRNELEDYNKEMNKYKVSQGLYSTSLKRVSDKNMIEYKQMVDRKNRERKQETDRNIKKSGEKKVEKYREQLKSGGMVDVDLLMKDSLDKLARGDLKDKDSFYAAVENVEACNYIYSHSETAFGFFADHCVEQAVFDRIRKEQAAGKEKFNEAQIEEVRKIVSRQEKGISTATKGYRVMNGIDEIRETSKRLRERAELSRGAEKTNEKEGIQVKG